MWSSWKGKRVRIDAASKVDALVRALAEMGLEADDLAGKGTELPQRDSKEWKKLGTHLNILLKTEEEGYLVQQWSKESIDALPGRTRRGLRIVTYDDVPKEKRHHTMKDSDRWIILDLPIAGYLASCVDVGMRAWDSPQDLVKHVKSLQLSTEQLRKLQLLAYTLQVPAMDGFINALQAKDLVGCDGEDAGREQRRLEKREGRKDTQQGSSSEAQNIGVLQCPILLPKTALLDPPQELASPPAEVDEAVRPKLLTFTSRSSGVKRIVRAYIGSHTSEGCAKALLSEMGCDVIQDLSKAQFDELMQAISWIIEQAGTCGGVISSPEASSYTSLVRLLTNLAGKETVKVVTANGSDNLMTCFILTGEHPAYVACLTDVRMGGARFQPQKLAETAPVMYEIKITEVMKDPKKLQDLRGQAKMEYIGGLAHSGAPILVAAGDHHCPGFAMFPCMMTPRSDLSRSFCAFLTVQLDPPLLAGLMLRWTAAADAYLSGDKNAFPLNLELAWRRLKDQTKADCTSVEEAEAAAAAMYELRHSRQNEQQSEDPDSLDAAMSAALEARQAGEDLEIREEVS